MGSGPFMFEAREAGAFVRGKRNPDYYSPGQALSRRLRGDLRQDAGGAGAGDPRRPGRSRVPRLAAEEPRRSRRRARQGHHGAGERLELRAARHAQPQEEAVRRRARAQGADAGGRPLGRIQGPFARSPSSRRSAASCSPAIRWRRPKEELEKLAGYWPDINKSRAEAKRLLKEAGVPDLKFTLSQPRRRPALHHRRHLADRPVEAGRRHGRAEGGGDRSVLRVAERRRFRRDDGLQLPVGRQSAARHLASSCRRRPATQYGKFEDRGADQDLRRHEQDGRRGRAEAS